MKHFSHKLVDRWYGSIGLLWILWPLEILYIGIIKLRRLLYVLKLFPSFRSPCPVIVVGSITLGGVGKTPVIIELARILKNEGFNVGIISRGYGRKKTLKPLLVNHNTNPCDCGDEPILIFEKTGCPIVVHESRRAAVELLTTEFTVDLILSDDGLQHYDLERDLEIVLVDNDRAFGNGHCLPLGPLREPTARLQEVDLVLYRGGDGPMAVRYLPGVWKQAGCSENNEQKNLPDLSFVHAIAGIGQPEQFFTMLEDMGLSLKRFSYRDHHRYQQSDFERHQGQTIVMTEKDAVKCRYLSIPDAWFFEIRVLLPKEAVKAVLALLHPSDKLHYEREAV